MRAARTEKHKGVGTYGWWLRYMQSICRKTPLIGDILPKS